MMKERTVRHCRSLFSYRQIAEIPVIKDGINQIFRAPDDSFRPVPWWCWNGEMDLGEMERQLREMKRKGINEFFIFALYGLEIPFLEEAWWKRVGWTLKKCREMGMKVWIYDDYNWPSGTCAGRVLRDYPKTRTHKFGIERILVKKGETAVFSPRGSLLGVIIEYPGKKAVMADPEISRQGKIAWKNSSSRDSTLIVVTRQISDYVGVCSTGAEWCTQQTGYLDTLDRKAVGIFISSIHHEYEKRFKSYFGNTLVGFFTDEPQISTYNGTYCSKAVFEQFRKKYGYDLKSRLHELLCDTGRYQITRYHFWSLLTHLFSRSYMKQISDWCGRRGLLHTGHLLGEESLAWNVTYSGDFYETQKYLQVPGIDLLRSETSYDPGKLWWPKTIDRKGLIVTAKLVSGTARFTGGKRAMCEAFGVLSWGQTMEEQKRVLDWLSALGINLINDNALTYTIKGFRKRAASGKHFTTPWWKYYKFFTDYARRLSLLCFSGKLEASIGVLYPTTDAWCMMKPQADAGMRQLIESRPPKLVRLEETLGAVVDALLRTHRDFEFLFDEVILAGSVKDGSLRIGDACFKTIILPGIETVRDDVYARLREFAESGGRLIVVRRRPEFAISPEKRRLKKIKPLRKTIRISLPKNSRAFEARLAFHLPLEKSAWKITGDGRREVISSLRKIPGGRVLFLGNQSSESMGITVSWKFASAVSLCDPDTGSEFSILPEQKGKNFYTNLLFAPHQSIFLVAVDSQVRPPGKIFSSVDQWSSNSGSPKKTVFTLPDRWNFATESPNMFLPWFRLFPVKQGSASVKSGLPPNEQAGWKKVDREGKASIGLSPDHLAYFWLRTAFVLDHIPEDLAVVVDSSNYDEVWLNNRKLPCGEPCVLWDSHNLKYPIGKYAHTGNNLLLLKVKPEPFYAEKVRPGPVMPNFIEPIVLTGSFRVTGSAGREILQQETGILTTGSWTRQGYPWYAGTGIYSCAFILKSLPEKVFLEMEKVAEVADIRINAEQAGVRPWPPYTVDISNMLVKGENRIEIRVTNSFGNLIQRAYFERERESFPAGILGTVRIVEAKKIR